MLSKFDPEYDLSVLFSLKRRKITLEKGISIIREIWKRTFSSSLLERFWREWSLSLMGYWVSARSLNLSRVVGKDFDRIRDLTAALELCRSYLQGQEWGRELSASLSSTLGEVAHFSGGVYRTLVRDVDQALSRAYTYQSAPDMVPDDKDVTLFLSYCHFIYHSMAFFLFSMVSDFSRPPEKKLFEFSRDFFSSRRGLPARSLDSRQSFFRYLALDFCLENYELLESPGVEPWPGVTGPLKRLIFLWTIPYRMVQ